MHCYSLGSNTHYDNTCEYYQSQDSYTTANYYDYCGTRRLVTAAATTTVTSTVILCNTTTQYEYVHT